MLFSHSVVSDSLRLHGLQHARLPTPSPGACSDSMSIESVMLSSHLILCFPLLLLPSIFPSVRSFPIGLDKFNCVQRFKLTITEESGFFSIFILQSFYFYIDVWFYRNLMKFTLFGISREWPRCLSRKPPNSPPFVSAKSLQSCLTPCDPMDCSPPDSSLQGVLQARILELVAKPSSRGSS